MDQGRTCLLPLGDIFRGYIAFQPPPPQYPPVTKHCIAPPDLPPHLPLRMSKVNKVNTATFI